MGTRPRPAIERVLDKTSISTDPAACWVFRGARLPNGYGATSAGRGVTLMVHRVSYEHFAGPIPAGAHLDHLCRNRLCVNPAHLEAVAVRTNILRGVSPSAANARKTECNHGHPFSDENTYVCPSGKRRCRTCKSAYQTSYRAKRSAA